MSSNRIVRALLPTALALGVGDLLGEDATADGREQIVFLRAFI